MPPEIEALIAKPHLLMVVLAIGAFFGMTVERTVTEMRRRAWRGRSRGRRNNAYRKASVATVPTLREAAPPRPSDAADQLRIVMGAAFTVQPLLNKSEARVFKELDRMVIALDPSWQVMAQVSLGEILRSQDVDAYGWVTGANSRARRCGIENGASQQSRRLNPLAEPEIAAGLRLIAAAREFAPLTYGCINSKRVDLLLVDGDCQPRHAIEYQGGAHHQGTAAARDAVKKEALRRAGIGYHEVVAGQTTPSELRRLVEKLMSGS
jgi:hypothetical protein